MGKNTSVIGIYEDRATIADAMDGLHKAGYRAADISVLTSDNQGSKDFAHEKRSQAPARSGIARGPPPPRAQMPQRRSSPGRNKRAASPD